MRHFIFLTFLITIILFSSCSNKATESAIKYNSVSSMDKKQNYISDEVLVKFAPGTAPETIESLQKKLGLKMVRNLSVPDLYLMKITGNTSIEEIINYLNDYREVLYAEPNYLYRKDNE